MLSAPKVIEPGEGDSRLRRARPTLHARNRRLREALRRATNSSVLEVQTRDLLLAAAGTDVATIGRILGHRPGSVVTLRYLHTDDDRMKQAAEAVAMVVSGA